MLKKIKLMNSKERNRIPYALLFLLSLIFLLGSCDSLLGNDDKKKKEEEEGETDDVVVTEVADPIFSQATGTYAAGFSLTLSCATSGATIYYTTDGFIHENPATVYSAPISLSGHTAVWAFAQKQDVKSKIVRADYAIIANETGNLIGNGDFTLGESLWNTWVHADLGAAASFSFADKKAVITQTAPGSEPWAMGITYIGKPTIRNGKIYTVKFTASASQARMMNVEIGENNRDLNSNGEVYDRASFKTHKRNDFLR